MRFQFFRNYLYAVLVTMLLPGMGHLLWGEWLFGLFVFLVMILAAAVFYASFILQGPLWLYLILLTLPGLFYIFALIDLSRSIRERRAKYSPSTRRALIILGVALAGQIFIPGAPLSFAAENCPSVFKATTNDYSPQLRKDEIAFANGVDYFARVFYFDRALYHFMPERYDLVRYVTPSGEHRTGLVIGLTEEDVEVVDGVIVANGLPIIEDDQGIILSGDCSLTSTGPYSILIADLYLGSIRTAEAISLFDIVGKVYPVL